MNLYVESNMYLWPDKAPPPPPLETEMRGISGINEMILWGNCRLHGSRDGYIRAQRARYSGSDWPASRSTSPPVQPCL